MVRVRFTSNLERHVSCSAAEFPATTVREALDAVFRDNPMLRGYVLDDQGALRRHVVVFVNGEMVTDRVRLSDRLNDDDELFVMQALSGG